MEFILARHISLYAIVAFLSALLNAYIVIPSILDQIVVTSMPGPPGPARPPTPFMGISLALAHLIFSLVSVSVAASMAGELASTSLFHLSQPLRRSEYSFSWLLTIVWLPSILMALSLFVPISAFDPRLVLRVSFQPIYLRLVEDILMFSIFCWAALTKKRGIVAFIGIFFILLLPYLSLVILGLISYVFLGGGNPPSLLLTIYEIIFPSTASTLFLGSIGQLSLDPMQASLGTLIISAFVQLSYFLYFIRRFEVK